MVRTYLMPGAILQEKPATTVLKTREQDRESRPKPIISSFDPIGPDCRWGRCFFKTTTESAQRDGAGLGSRASARGRATPFRRALRKRRSQISPLVLAPLIPQWHQMATRIPTYKNHDKFESIIQRYIKAKHMVKPANHSRFPFQRYLNHFYIPATWTINPLLTFWPLLHQFTDPLHQLLCRAVQERQSVQRFGKYDRAFAFRFCVLGGG